MSMRLWINGSARVNLELRVPYNTLYNVRGYNVSIIATPPCGQDTVTRSSELFYCKFTCILAELSPATMNAMHNECVHVYIQLVGIINKI